MERIFRPVRGVATAGAAIIAALLVAAFGPTLLGAHSLIVASGSMEPTMPTGSVAVTRPVDIRAIEIGDIVTFRERGAEQPTTHRVIDIDHEPEGAILTTKGDANPAPDPNPFLVADTIERVERVIPFAGTIVGVARSPFGAILFILLPVAGLTAEHRRRRADDAVRVCPRCHRDPPDHLALSV